MSKNQRPPPSARPETAVPQPEPGEKTYPCRNCGRKFVQMALQKHEQVCSRMSSKKRKTFESGKQRATGSDIPLQSVVKVKKELEKFNGVMPRPKTNWRERHETFVSNVRAAKGVDIALKTGSPLPPPPRSQIPSDYIKCDYCGRSFAQQAAERHIPHCKEKNARSAPMKAAPPAARGGPMRGQQPPQTSGGYQSYKPPQTSNGYSSAQSSYGRDAKTPAQRSQSTGRQAPQSSKLPQARGRSPGRGPTGGGGGGGGAPAGGGANRSRQPDRRW